MTRLGPALLLCALAASGARRPLAVEDWWEWRNIASPRISPDGAWVVYVETWNHRATDTACSNLWAVGTDGKTRRQLTLGAWRDTLPRWSLDGSRLAYISDREGQAQIRVRGFDSAQDSGQETQLPAEQLPLSLAWSPDGKSIAYTASVRPAPEPAAWAPAAILPLLVPVRASRVGLFVVSAGGGVARQFPLGDLDAQGEPAWMPDGQSILVSAAAAPDAARPLEGAEIYAIRLRDGGLRRLTQHPGPDENPAPSPDGGKIAWTAREPKPQSYVIRKLYVMNADGSRVKVLAGALDRDIVNAQWSSDSRTLYFLADDHGATRVYSARSDGSVRQVTKAPERLRGFSLADNGRAVAVRSAASAPAEVIAFPVDVPGSPVKLAAANEALLAERDLGAVEELHYQSDGKTIQGWLVKPPAFDPARKYPLLLVIQDAPRRMCGFEFQLRAQMFAARGYLVLCANPRGTPGYGEEFGNLIHSRFPGDDFDDLMRGVDLVLAKGYADPQRLSVFGGVLAAWAIGHTGRFHAAVARRPVADWVLDVATAEDGYSRAAAWMGAMPWDNPEQYMKHSPIFFAQNFKTPTLILAGERDPASDELYFALRARKVDSALVRLGDASPPSRMILEMETILAWIGR